MRTAILGGGLSGLTTAFYLSKRLPASHKIILYEKSSRFGGWVQTIRNENGLTFESGPRSVRPVGLPGFLTLDLIRQLGLEKDLITVSKSHPAAKNRFIYFNKRLNKAPNSLASAISASFDKSSPFAGLLSKVASEPFKKPLQSVEDESVDSFVSRRFGPSFSANVLSALVHGIYAGDTRKLSIQAVFPSLAKLEQRYGSVVKGLLRGGLKAPVAEQEALKDLQTRLGDIAKQMSDASVYSLRDGLEAIPKSLVQYLHDQSNVELYTNRAVDSIQSDGKQMQLQTSEGLTKVDRVISALSVEHLARLVPDLPIRHIPSVTVGVVNIAFPIGHRLPVQGFGYLIPRSVPVEENPHKALGVVFDSQMFDSAGPVKVTVMMGGAYWQDASPPDLRTLEQGAVETLRLHGLLPAEVEPIFVQAHLHKDCIPQYPVGHCANMRDLHNSLLDDFKGKLSVVGSSYSGVGLNDCVKSSWDLTNRIAEEQVATGLEGFL